MKGLPSDAAELLALEPEELALRMLPSLVWRRAESLTLESYLFTLTGTAQTPNGSRPIGPFGSHQVPAITDAIMEAWMWLEGQGLLIPVSPRNIDVPARKLSRRGQGMAAAANPADMMVGRKLLKEVLHASIREDVWSHFHRGKFDTAVFEAMRAVEIAVRAAGGYEPKDLGVPLMRRAFDPEKGPLTDMTDPYPEREACASLFAGTIGLYKNRQSHRKVGLGDPNEAGEIIMVANHLLRIVEARATGLTQVSGSH